MADSREVFAFPEATLYLYTAASSGIFAYAQDIQVQVSRSLTKFTFPVTGVGYAARTKYVETDKQVTLSIGALFAGASLYQMMASGNSGVNISATVNFLTSADGATATFTLWSAQMPDFSLQGGEGGLWRQSVKIIAPDISGV